MTVGYAHARFQSTGAIFTASQPIYAVFPFTFLGKYQNAYEERHQKTCQNSSVLQCCDDSTYGISRNRTLYNAFRIEPPLTTAIVTTRLSWSESNAVQFQTSLSTNASISHEVLPSVRFALNVTLFNLNNENVLDGSIIFHDTVDQSGEGMALHMSL